VQFESKSKLQTLKSMPTGDPALIDFIRDTIRREGPVTFAWFMEQALYHPVHGYYSSGRCAIGRRGDYFTNVSVGPLFGRLLATQFAEMWELLGCPDDFTIVEQGAHHGNFAADVLAASRVKAPEFFSAVRYCVIEPFSILQQRQAETLCDFRDKVTWEKSLNDLDPFRGVHFSNEVLDAMPVHLLARTEGGDDWKQRWVVESGDGFVFATRPITDGRLRQQVQKIPRHEPGDYETEANLATPGWIENVSRRLIRGYVLTVDYGYSRDEFYAPERTRGTLQCRAQHRAVASPLEQIGQADITAHVDWTSVAERAEECGLSVHGFADQHHFITGLLSHLARHEAAEETEPSTRRALQTLLHPELLGTRFQFLALGKDTPSDALGGFAFARDACKALGLL
jgi:SAM-dependent MidA family methyltransferase